MKIHRIVVPISIILAICLGVISARWIAIPSISLTIHEPDHGFTRKTTRNFTISGMQCVDTAERAASALKGMDGVYSFTVYASRNLATITFDPERVDEERIRKALEGPIFDPESGSYLFRQFEVKAIDRTFGTD